MEIYYCASCKKRVSSIDLEHDRGFNTPNGKVVCRACAKSLGIQGSATPSSQPAAQTPQFRQGPRSPARTSAHGSGRLAPIASQFNNAIVIVIVLIVVLIGGILFGVLYKRGKQPVLPTHATPSGPAPLTYADPDQPEPVPVRAPEPVAEPASAPAALPAEPPAPAGDWIDLMAGNALASGWQITAGVPGQIACGEDMSFKTEKIDEMFRLQKEVKLPANADIEFDFESSGVGWDLIVKSIYGNEKVNMAFFGQQVGSYKGRIEIRGTDVRCLVNGKTWSKAGSSLAKPLRGTTKVWLQIQADTSLRFKLFRYRSAAD